MSTLNKIELAKEILEYKGMEENDTYFIIQDGKILAFDFTYSLFDIDNILSGNFFSSIKEAKEHKEKL